MINLLKKLFINKINGGLWILLLTMCQEYILKTDFSKMSGKEISVSIIGLLIIIIRAFFHTPDKKLQRLKDRGIDVDTLSRKNNGEY